MTSLKKAVPEMSQFCCVPKKGGGGGIVLLLIAIAAVIGIGVGVYDAIVAQAALIEAILTVIKWTFIGSISTAVLGTVVWNIQDQYRSKNARREFDEYTAELDEKRRERLLKAIAAQKDADYASAITGDVEDGLITPLNLDVLGGERTRETVRIPSQREGQHDGH